MWLVFGLSLMAIGLLAVRGAFVLTQRQSTPRHIGNFVRGSLFAVMATGLIATGAVSFANALLSDRWKAITMSDLAIGTVIVALAVALWAGLGRRMRRAEPSTTASILTMPSSDPPNPPATKASGRAPKRRAA